LGGGELLIRPLRGLPEIAEGDDLGALIARSGEPGGDEIVVISQKVVSKAEGRLRRLADVEPTARAIELGQMVGKDARLAQLALDESVAVVRAAPGVLITRTRGGWVCANAGIDSSNLEDEGMVTLLPEDADRSARGIRARLLAEGGTAPGVIVADSFGRPWRLGQTDIAIGCAGVVPIDDWRGRRDRHGRKLEGTEIATLDEIAGAADLVRAKDSGIPAAVVAGLAQRVSEEDGPGAAALRRPEEEDLFL
jgi:coenzyme F420-0:L-glutamate ligase / coenzyme F420-1:gamma-L-glutamate ligase